MHVASTKQYHERLMYFKNYFTKMAGNIIHAEKQQYIICFCHSYVSAPYQLILLFQRSWSRRIFWEEVGVIGVRKGSKAMVPSQRYLYRCNGKIYSFIYPREAKFILGTLNLPLQRYIISLHNAIFRRYATIK